MKKMGGRLNGLAGAVCAVSVLLGCSGTLSVGTDTSSGGMLARPDDNRAGNETNPLGDGGAPENIGGSGGAPNNTAGNGGLFAFGGTVSFVPGVECTCDDVGDSTCSGSLRAMCGQVPGCKGSLSDVRLSDICGDDTFYAHYTQGAQTVISYGLGSSSDYQMVFDTTSGEFVGGSLNGHVGLACNLAGKTEFSEGVQIKDDNPTCRLCGGDGGGGLPKCPAGTLIP